MGTSHARPGKLSCFLVHVADRYRNLCTSGGTRVCVKASGPTHPIISVLDLFDGSHQVKIRYGLSGSYQLTVTVGSAAEQPLPVAGSPLTVRVTPPNTRPLHHSNRTAPSLILR